MQAITAKYAVSNFCRVFGPAHATPSRVRFAYGTLGIPEGALSRFIGLLRLAGTD